jgi:argininosuccinate lyase
VGEQSKLWQGRFNQSSSKILEEFNASIGFDYKMYIQDIFASKVHAEMLKKQGIINESDFSLIESGLNQIQEEIQKDPESWAKARIKDEDIHLAVERELTELIGEAGKKLHTARSRNDQVVTDLRLWLKSEHQQLKELLKNLRLAFITRAKQDIEEILPGYTHLQQAQPINLGHFWMAHEARFARDSERLTDALKRIDVNPLGSGALAGSTFNIDREYTTQKLGFARASENSLDAVSDRDFVAEYEFILSMIMIHLSQFAEEMIIWNSQEFGFIEINDDYATGSSMMPQKKNPDIPELLRGKSGRVIGVLNALLITLKSLPMAYNKDLQEDKELLFMANDTVIKCLKISADFLSNIKINSERMLESLSRGYTTATDIAEYLVKKGLPFREAYNTVGKIVKDCINQQKIFTDLSFAEWQSYHKDFDEDILEKISLQSSIQARDILGATASKQVITAIQFAETRLKNEN